MDMPTRIEIRVWLQRLSREEILEKLALIKQIHGPDNERDVRDFLNYEREQVRQGRTLLHQGEASLHDQKEQIKSSLELQKKLYGDVA